jgi:hypothetical protein
MLDQLLYIVLTTNMEEDGPFLIKPVIHFNHSTSLLSCLIQAPSFLSIPSLVHYFVESLQSYIYILFTFI